MIFLFKWSILRNYYHVNILLHIHMFPRVVIEFQWILSVIHFLRSSTRITREMLWRWNSTSVSNLAGEGIGDKTPQIIQITGDFEFRYISFLEKQNQIFPPSVKTTTIIRSNHRLNEEECSCNICSFSRVYYWFSRRIRPMARD